MSTIHKVHPPFVGRIKANAAETVDKIESMLLIKMNVA
jgi:hypothetical protein